MCCLDYGINVTQTYFVPQKITYSILFVCLFFKFCAIFYMKTIKSMLYKLLLLSLICDNNNERKNLIET